MLALCVIKKTGQVVECLSPQSIFPNSTSSSKPYRLYLCVGYENNTRQAIINTVAFNASSYAPSILSNNSWVEYTQALVGHVDEFKTNVVACPNFMVDTNGLHIPSPFRSVYNRVKLYSGTDSNAYITVAEGENLEIVKTDKFIRHVNLTNILPVIHGFSAFPEVDLSDPSIPVLVSNFGARHLRGTSKENQEIQLLDLTPLKATEESADAVFIRVGTTVNDVLVSNSIVDDVFTFTVPHEIELTNKSVIVSLFGRMFFSNRHATMIDPTTNTVSIRIPRHSLSLAQLDLSVATHNFTRNTIHINSYENDTELLAAIRTSDYQNFLIVIDNPNVCVSHTPPIYSINDGMIIFPPNADGILSCSDTGRIKEYVSVKFNDRTLVRLVDGEMRIVPATLGEHHMGRVVFRKLPKWFEHNRPLERHYEMLEIYTPPEVF